MEETPKNEERAIQVEATKYASELCEWSPFHPSAPMRDDMTTTPKKPQVYYFGCWGDGHFLWTPEQDSVRISRMKNETPFGDDIDGYLQGGSAICTGNGIPSNAQLHHKDGWTALAFWDRTVDTRPGSCSVFLAEGVHDVEAIKEIARSNFPEVWDRLHHKE